MSIIYIKEKDLEFSDTLLMQYVSDHYIFSETLAKNWWRLSGANSNVNTT